MSAPEKLSALATEMVNPDTRRIDSVSTLEMLAMINAEDAKVADVVHAALPAIAAAVDCIADAFLAGGRLVYLGAGTSGRLGILDASECVPTFGVPAGMVVGLIAGGPVALENPVEGAEDDEDAAARDLAALHFGERDVLVGIAASGRTPYVIGGLRWAAGLGAKTIALACVQNAGISPLAHIAIEVPTGPEAISGSTRMKAGTAQKMVLNMLSTGSMVRIGKVYGNLMIDVLATNDKLTDRALRIVQGITGAQQPAAEAALEAASWQVKTAVYMLQTNADAESARQKLAAAGGRLRQALQAAGAEP